MYKLVKWAYSLGIRNERHRIAAYLQSVNNNRFDAIDRFDSEMLEVPVSSSKDARARNIQEREQQKEIDRAIIDIIEVIFRSEQEYKRGASVMFPDEGEL